MLRVVKTHPEHHPPALLGQFLGPEATVEGQGAPVPLVHTSVDAGGAEGC